MRLRAAVLLALLPLATACIRWKCPRPGAPPSLAVMAEADYARTAHPVPYLVRIEAARGSLAYFGSDAPAAPRPPADPQVAAVVAAWDAVRPTLAFDEGADVPVLDTGEDAARHGLVAVVRRLAARDGVAVGPLPATMADEVAYLRHTYAPEHIVLYHALRASAEGPPAGVELRVQARLRELAAVPGLESGPRSTAALEALLRGRGIDWRSPHPSDLAPSERPQRARTVLNALAADLRSYREQHMITRLASAVRDGHRVFALAGARHVVLQEGALRVTLGRPGARSADLSGR